METTKNVVCVFKRYATRKAKVRLFSLHHVYSKDRQGTLCPHVQKDGVLFVRMCNTTVYYLSANAKMTGYYFAGVLFVRDSYAVRNA